MDKAVAQKNLIDFTNVLRKYKVRWFLTFGTCLGAFREGKIIEHDKDLDVGIMQEDFSYGMLKGFYDAGFQIKFTFGMRFLGQEIAFVRDGVKIDLMFFYTKGDKAYNALWQNGGRNGMSDIVKLVYPRNLFDEFVEMNMCGHNFLVVKNTEEYIKTIYGETWNVPDKEWQWWASPKNITNNFEL